MATSTSPNSDFDPLISRLACGLAPADRDAFRDAAESALAALPCIGEGIAHRVLRDVFRQYFRPLPDDARAYGARHQRSSKLADGPPLDEDSARGRAQARSRWMRGWRG
jgi:hypothetical protein